MGDSLLWDKMFIMGEFIMGKCLLWEKMFIMGACSAHISGAPGGPGGTLMGSTIKMGLL